MSLCVCEPPLHPRIVGVSGARSSSSVLTDSAAASRGRWSSARRRLPDSSLLRVDTSMLDHGWRPPRASGRAACAVRAAAAGPGRRRRSRSPSLPAWQMSLADSVRTASWRHERRRKAALGSSTTASATGSGVGGSTSSFADVAADLPPGRALDLGCGEGGDAVWLAERGWNVVAVDISETALTSRRGSGELARCQRPYRVRRSTTCPTAFPTATST